MKTNSLNTFPRMKGPCHGRLAMCFHWEMKAEIDISTGPKSASSRAHAQDNIVRLLCEFEMTEHLERINRLRPREGGGVIIFSHVYLST